MLSISAGPLVTTPHRLFFLLAMTAALLVGWLYGRRERIAVQPVLTQMVLYGLVIARVTFVAVYLEDYWPSLWRMLDVRDGGFFYSAGAVAATCVGIYHAWRHPVIRATLGLAVASGLLVFGVTIGFFNAMLAAQPQVDALTLTTLDGSPTSLSALQGKPVVVNLWATWCPPCRREMPVLAEAQQREHGVEFVFVNQGEPASTINEYLNRNALHLKNVFLDHQREWSSQLGAQAMPTTLFFDAEGVLAGSHTGELSAASLKQALKRITNPNTGE